MFPKYLTKMLSSSFLQNSIWVSIHFFYFSCFYTFSCTTNRLKLFKFFLVKTLFFSNPVQFFLIPLFRRLTSSFFSFNFFLRISFLTFVKTFLIMFNLFILYELPSHSFRLAYLQNVLQ